MDKIAPGIPVIFTISYICRFKDMREKFAFIVVQKSREKKASTERFNVTNIISKEREMKFIDGFFKA
jgi:hypothetical protein